VKVPRRIADAVAGAEDALDRLKLAYKERFDRFDPARPVPYRGWGRPDRLVLRGRVLEDDETGFEPEAGLWTNIRNTIRRLETDEIRGALLKVTFRDQAIEVRADDEAFFEVRFEPDPPAEPGWHEVRIEVVECVASAHVGPVTGEVHVTAPDADFLVVSDLEEEHERGAIDELLEFYPGIPLLLIGDSGQRDPEIYRSIALDRPERVRAILIRDVTTPERDREVHGIAEEVRTAGVPMFLAADSAGAARSAAEAGLLAH